MSADRIAPFSDAVYALYETHGGAAGCVFVAPQEFDAMVKEMERKRGFPITDKNSRCAILGITLVPDPGVSPGIAVLLAVNGNFLGAARVE